jgi:hypothetical protein
MLRQAAYFSSLLIILLVGAIGIERAFSESFQRCISWNEYSDAKDTAKNDPPSFDVTLGSYIRCSGRFVDNHGAGITALASLIIAAFTGTLWIATGRLGKSAERQIIEASQLRKIIEKQTALIGAQADILDHHKEIARFQVITTHRPRLIIRNIIIASRNIRGTFFAGMRLAGRCYVQNVGGMSATITESHLVIYGHQMGLPMESPYERASPNNVITLGKLNIGESKICTFDLQSPFANDEEAERGGIGEFPFFVLGWVHYRDDTAEGILKEVTHRLAFCRRWDARKRRFVREENDPDYEHDG